VTPTPSQSTNSDGTDAAIRRFHAFLSRDGDRILLIGGTVAAYCSSLLLARGIIGLA
jgi:hypothetical protein